MRIIFFCSALLFFFVNAEAQVDYSGNYRFQSRVFYDKDSELKPKKDEVSQGRMGDVTLIKVDSVKYKFWLSVNRGWPSYNQGDINGFIYVNNGKALFKEKLEYAENSCEIAFVFRDGFVEIDQGSTDSDCGFGMSVYANGEYKKKRQKKIVNADLENLYIDFSKYKIIAGKAFLFEDATGKKMKKQYFIKDDIVLTTDENDSFVYAEYISASGKFIYGWLKKADIIRINS